MLKVVAKDVYRGGEKIGYFSGSDIYNEENRKLGYFSGNDIYDINARKLGYIESNSLKTADGKTMRLDEIHKHVQGGAISDLERAAILLLVGD